MGQDETTQASRVCTHVPGLNPSHNTMDNTIYIPTNTSKHGLYEHTHTRLCQDPHDNHIATGSLSQ